MGELIWHRTPDEYPDVGSTVALVVHRDDSSRVTVRKRMRVAAVTKSANLGALGIYGPILAGGDDFEIPARPDTFVGTIVMWRYVE